MNTVMMQAANTKNSKPKTKTNITTSSTITDSARWEITPPRPSPSTQTKDSNTSITTKPLTLTKDSYVGEVLTEDLEQWVPNLTRSRLEAKHWALRTHPAQVAAALAAQIADVEATIVAGTTVSRFAPKGAG